MKKAYQVNCWMYLSRRAVAAALALSLFSISLLAGADTGTPSSVWVISSGDQKVYLGGTVHLLRPSDYPLPEQYEKAYQDADKLYFETDISGMSDMGTQARMLQQLTYQDERTLESELNEEAYKALVSYLQTAGLPIAMVQKFKPGLLISTLSVIAMQKMGFSPQGVDAFFNTRAREDGKPVGQFESIDDQIGFLATMGEGYESEYILLSLTDLAKTEVVAQMIDAWRSGDEDKLITLIIDEMKAQSAELYENILVSRNKHWLPMIEAMFSQQGTEFVLVGAAHLIGEEGLLQLLAGKGYTISRL
jgi:uncharacterized protein YbaP (TraB family)